MGFQLSNNEGDNRITPNSSSPDENTNQTQSVPNTVDASPTDSDFQDDKFFPDYNDTPFIADRYQKTEPQENPSEIKSATILTQNNSFIPILMYIGAGFYIIALIYAFIALSSGNNTVNGVLLTISKLLSIGGIFCIVDAIIMACKNCGGWSLVFWAWLFPPVYWLKRFEANGDSQLIPIIIIGINIFLVILAGIGSVTGKEKRNAAVGEVVLEMFSINIDGNSYSYSQLIDNNILNAEYKYKPATASDPEYLILTGDTTVRGYSEPIEIRWNYGTMKIVSISLGNDVYDSNNLYDILVLLSKNAASAN